MSAGQIRPIWRDCLRRDRVLYRAQVSPRARVIGWVGEDLIVSASCVRVDGGPAKECFVRLGRDELDEGVRALREREGLMPANVEFQPADLGGSWRVSPGVARSLYVFC